MTPHETQSNVRQCGNIRTLFRPLGPFYDSDRIGSGRWIHNVDCNCVVSRRRASCDVEPFFGDILTDKRSAWFLIFSF